MTSRTHENINEISQETINHVIDVGTHIAGTLCNMALPMYNQYTNSNIQSDIPNPKWCPYSEIKKTNSHIKIMISMPGVEKENIEAYIVDNKLQIKATTSIGNSGTWDFLKEKEYDRSFDIPVNLTMENINITYVNGILKILVNINDTSNGIKIPIS